MPTGVQDYDAIAKRTIGDTGMTVGEMRQWFADWAKVYLVGVPNSFEQSERHRKIVDALLDALEAAQREADEAKKRADKAEAQIAECEEANEALCEKIKSLSAHHTCGCSYDTREDVCMHHSPQLTAALGRAEKAEAQVAEMRDACLKAVSNIPPCPFDGQTNLEPSDPCPICGDRGDDPSAESHCRSAVQVVRSLPLPSGNKAMAVIEAAKAVYQNYSEECTDEWMEEKCMEILARALAEFEGGGK